MGLQLASFLARFFFSSRHQFSSSHQSSLVSRSNSFFPGIRAVYDQELNLPSLPCVLLVAGRDNRTDNGSSKTRILAV